MKKLSVVFYPNFAKKSSKNNLIPIYMRISKNGSKTEARLDASIQEEDCRFWNEITQRIDKKNNDVNKKLEEIINEFEGLPYIYKEGYKSFTPKDVKEKILKLEKTDNVNTMTALRYVENHYKNVVMSDKEMSDGTKRNYRKAINHFTKYLTFVKNSDCLLIGVNQALALDFFDYLKKDVPKINKQSMQSVSASCIIIKLKVIFGRAEDDEIIRKNPFKKIKLTTESPKRAELNISEVKKLVDLNLSEDKKLDIYRDKFLFGVFTGLPYGEVNNLRWTDLYIKDDIYCITKSRLKSGMEIKQILVIQAKRIIEKYKNNYEANILGTLLPKKCLNSINKNLKIIKAMAGIQKPLSTHIARHTCNQLLSDLGNINGDVINSMLGWSNGKMGSSKFYRSTTTAMVTDAKNKFENFLNKNL